MMVQLLYGDYGLAGLLTAVVTLAYAIGAPILAKLVDNFGQAKVMLPSITISIMSTALMVLAALKTAPPWVLAVLGVISGATSGSIGALARTRWPNLVTSPQQIQTAYALEAAIDEICFVLGPVIGTVAATTIHPVAGLVLLISLFVVGGYGFLLQRSTEPKPVPKSLKVVTGKKTRTFTPLLGMLAITYMGAGMVFGINDIAVVAFASEQGYPSLSGTLLAIMSFGSLVAALLYGAYNWKLPMWKRFIFGVFFMAVGVSTFAFAQSLWVMALVLLVTGLTLAPTMTNVNTIVEMVTPKENLTESLTWLSTAMCIGISLGSALAGTPVQNSGSHAGFLLVICAGWVMVGLAASGLPLVKRQTEATLSQRRQHLTEELV